MITFVPIWKDISYKGESLDDLMGPIKAVSQSKLKYQIIINEYIPNLRYLLHRYALLESNFYNVFDELQGLTEIDQRKVSIADLGFGSNLDYVYTPFSIVIYRKHIKIGKVYFGEASQISEVHYYKNTELNSIDIYDDRGIVTSRKKFLNGDLEFSEYLDQAGNWIFKCYNKNGECLVNPSNSKFLSLERYRSIFEIQSELLEKKASDFTSPSSLILSVSDQNIDFIKGSTHVSKMILSFFKKRLHEMDINSHQVSTVLPRVKGILTDDKKYLESVINPDNNHSKIHQLSPYDTRLTLSRTTELFEEIIYVDIRGNREHEVYELLKNLLNFQWESISPESSKRKFKIVIRVDSYEHIHDKIRQYFQENFSNITEEVFSTSSLGENNIDTEVIDSEYIELQKIKQLFSSVEPIIINSDDELFKIINTTRLIIDVSDSPDLFTQISGISAGIPQINKIDSNYVQRGTNGIIIDDLRELGGALEYYMNSLENWQKARVYAVKKIKQYSGVSLQKEIEKIVGEKFE